MPDMTKVRTVIVRGDYVRLTVQPALPPELTPRFDVGAVFTVAYIAADPPYDLLCHHESADSLTLFSLRPDHVELLYLAELVWTQPDYPRLRHWHNGQAFHPDVDAARRFTKDEYLATCWPLEDGLMHPVPVRDALQAAGCRIVWRHDPQPIMTANPT